MKVGKMEEEEKVFCYITIPNTAMLILSSLYIGLSLLLVAKALLTFCRLLGSHSKHTILVYSMILLWWMGIPGSS